MIVVISVEAQDFMSPKLRVKSRTSLFLVPSFYSLFTYNACITPGTHPKIVSTMLRIQAVPKPLFIRTATGGSRTLRTIVSNDIFSLVLSVKFDFQYDLVRKSKAHKYFHLLCSITRMF